MEINSSEIKWWARGWFPPLYRVGVKAVNLLAKVGVPAQDKVFVPGKLYRLVDKKGYWHRAGPSAAALHRRAVMAGSDQLKCTSNTLCCRFPNSPRLLVPAIYKKDVDTCETKMLNVTCALPFVFLGSKVYCENDPCDGDFVVSRRVYFFLQGDKKICVSDEIAKELFTTNFA